MMQVDRITNIIKKWNHVETLTYYVLGKDKYDPYYTLLFDVYYKSELPSKVERRRIFDFAEFIETSRITTKDRMLIDDVPVRINYKSLEEVESFIKDFRSDAPRYYVQTTYPLWRISHFEVHYTKGEWFSNVKMMIAELPDSFWVRQLRILRKKVEHILVDMKSALFAKDDFFFFISSSSFIWYLIEFFHVAAHRFVPPGKLLGHSLRTLPGLSEELSSRISTFFRDKSDLSHAQRLQLAELIVQNAFSS